MTDKQNKSKRILTVMANPHDLPRCIEACGIHAAGGARVTVVPMTNGGTKHSETYTIEIEGRG